MKTPQTLHTIPATPAPITPEETALIARFRILDNDSLRMVMSVLDCLYEHCKDESRKTKPVLLLIQGSRP